jgi:hypothetical protein
MRDVKDNKMFYPVCSEIVGRLDGKPAEYDNDGDPVPGKGVDFEIDTSTYPNHAVEKMLELVKKGLTLDDCWTDNQGGGGDYSYVECCYDIAEMLHKEKMDTNQIVRFLDEALLSDMENPTSEDIKDMFEAVRTVNKKKLKGAGEYLFTNARLTDVLYLMKALKATPAKIKEMRSYWTAKKL